MASPMVLSNLTLTDFERSKSRSLRFSVVGYLYGIDIFASSNITTIWISQKAVCWRAGFSAVLAVFLVELYFYSNNGHNSVENDHTGKNFILVLKTTYKKVFLKYHVNTRFLSLCLVSDNAIFSGGRLRTKIKAHR